MKAKIILLLLIPAFFNVNATQYTTVADGSWNTSSIWSPSKPSMTWGFTDTVIINNNVTLSSNLSVFGYFVINSGASLSGSSKNLTVKEDAIFTNNGTLSVKNFKADWGTTTVVNNGSLTTSQNFYNYEGTFTNNGTISCGSNFKNEYDGTFTNSSSGTITVSGSFTNYDTFDNQGALTVTGSITNDWSCTFTNSGNITTSSSFSNKGTLTSSNSITVGNGFTNKGTLSSSGSLAVTGNFTNDWSCGYTNTGSLSVSGNTTNKGTWNNSGTQNLSGNMTNKGDITNSGTLNIGGNLTNQWSSNTITNNAPGSITVTNNLVNNGTIHNNSTLLVDGNYSGSGNVDGSGSLCNSDGVTDPTGGAKSVTCPICSDGSGLPVELVSFESSVENRNVILSWQTASEVNNHYFEVLRSADGYNYEVVGKVLGRGNSNALNSYSLLDKDVQPGIYYYKLRQTDYDGTVKEYKILKVIVGRHLDVKIYPNPVLSGSMLTIATGTTEMKKVEIYDITGKLLKSVNDHSQNIGVNLSGLQPGYYIVTVMSGSDRVVQRIQVN